MKRTLISNRWTRCLAACMALLVSAQMSEAAVLPLEEPQQQQTAPAQQQQAQESSSLTGTEMAALPQAPDPAGQQATDNQQQAPAQNPLGTAAGPTTRPTGVAGTRPAGAAIAPARQRRVRAFFIKTSIIIAAAGAAGAVVALSKASPARPQ